MNINNTPVGIQPKEKITVDMFASAYTKTNTGINNTPTGIQPKEEITVSLSSPSINDER